MRYRPFTIHGHSISAISLFVEEGLNAADAYRLMCGALEHGINAFSIAAGDEGVAEALRQVVAAVGRRVLIVMLRLDLQGPPFDRQVRAALQTSGATYFDVVFLDRPPPDALASLDLVELQGLRGTGRVVRLGLASEAADAPPYLKAVDFDILAIRYNVCSGWPERNLLKDVGARGMTVVGYGHQVTSQDALGGEEPPAKGLSRLFRRAAPAMPQAYDFLQHTPDWSAAQITLAYALTEPALATVMVEAEDVREIEALASAVEQELPAGVAAQIEIARFAIGARRSVA